RWEPGHDRLGDTPGLSHAKGHDDVSRPRPPEGELRGVVERRRPPSPNARGHVIEDALPRDARLRLVAASDDVRDHGAVCETERSTQLETELPRPLEHVRLVDGDQSTLGLLPSGRERGSDLGRVVAVVVVHAHTRALADELKAAVDPLEAEDRRLR